MAVTSTSAYRRLVRSFSRQALDSVLAVVLAALALSELRWHWSGYYGGGSAWANVPLALLATLPLAARRRYPVAALATVGAAFLIPQAIGHAAMSFWGDFVPYAIALYTVSASTPARRAAVALVGGIAAFGLIYVGRPEFRRANEVAFDLLVLGVAVAGGQIARHRGQLEARNALLVRGSEEEARVAVERERARIARELHDVIAHNVSVMLVQSAAAQRVLRRDPNAAATMLDAVQAAGREAVGEMQTLLGILRHDDEPWLGPQPGMARLEELLDHVRDAGLTVDVRREGEERALPAPVDMSAYRIVQEALTNTLKHAGPTRAEIVVRYLEDGVELEVCDDGNRAAYGASSNGGHGLLGMRERVLLYGGEFEAGPRAGTGFRIRARFPLPA
jgi:signal transduction histidine kinase